ncbi:hypothetical protein [Actinotalea sp. K2]|uniref:hypothetical protein n=1 Tax=Actinotalea sp. K2 TaxID=2939438 RepID=UPI002018143F|nr:hypothetical protein [Actinotalea sp. K2]MCL3861613.1 hypothetical protein [Actinotalea sp. K2]
MSLGFSWLRRKGGDVVIQRAGAVVTVLRGGRAAQFLEEVTADDDQQVMARWTGSYRFGNERQAREHPRNRGRRGSGR